MSEQESNEEIAQSLMDSWLKRWSYDIQKKSIIKALETKDQAIQQAYEKGKKEGFMKSAALTNRFQDITGWQKGDSRNQLICDIEEEIRKAGKL